MARVVEVAGLQKTYALGGESVAALRGVDLSLEAGEFVAVMGPSGSGKSTFMHIVGLLDTPTAGTYRFEDCLVSTLSPDARADIRGRRLGFVFQAYNLLPRTSAVENVELPMVYAGVPETERRRIALEKLEAIGIPQLDTQSSQDIMRLFTRLNADEGITIMIVTHEPEVAAYARRIVTFRDGLITNDTLNQRRAA
jgi:putative ABC transport system ATP-binding protein